VIDTLNLWIALFILAAGYIAVPVLALIRGLRRRRRARAAEIEKQTVAEETARRHAKAIEESRKALEASRSPAVMAAHIDVIRDHAEKLSALAEHYDLPDVAPSTPSDLKIFYRDEKDRILHDRTMEQVETAMAKAGEIPRRAGKITYLERALILCLEGKRTTGDEDLARVFDEKAAQIQQAIAGVIAPPPSR
jgi:hypothetical protein